MLATWGEDWFGATTGRASTLVAVVSRVCPGLLLLVRALSVSFLFTSLGSRRCPIAGLGIGVRLVVLWVSGHTADPLVVAVLSSYFLRLISNRLSTERKRFGLDAVPTPG